MTCKREAELLAEIEQTGAMYKVSVLQLIKAGSRIAELEALNGEMGQFNAGIVHEIDDIQLALSRCNETKTALQMNFREAHKERDGLAAQNQALLSIILNMDCGSPTQVLKAQKSARSWPDTSADILRARDARVLRDAAERLESHDFVMNSSGKWYAEASELRKLADDLEQKK